MLWTVHRPTDRHTRAHAVKCAFNRKITNLSHRQTSVTSPKKIFSRPLFLTHHFTSRLKRNKTQSEWWMNSFCWVVLSNYIWYIHLKYIPKFAFKTIIQAIWATFLRIICSFQWDNPLHAYAAFIVVLYLRLSLWPFTSHWKFSDLHIQNDCKSSCEFACSTFDDLLLKYILYVVTETKRSNKCCPEQLVWLGIGKHWKLRFELCTHKIHQRSINHS